MPHFPTSDGRAPWTATVLTLFPEMFPGPLSIVFGQKKKELKKYKIKALTVTSTENGKTINDSRTVLVNNR